MVYQIDKLGVAITPGLRWIPNKTNPVNHKLFAYALQQRRGDHECGLRQKQTQLHHFFQATIFLFLKFSARQFPLRECPQLFSRPPE
mmetsp:Transcript_138471/g.276035  ORF Transcript_138471/g.276035 Transcript_138471/m.276035 type:complete len:87 (-) Transcript_138471:89-349(-)